MEFAVENNNIVSNIITICNDINYNTLNKFVYKNSEIIHLTANETRLLEYFLENKWVLITKTMLINSVWWEHETSKVSDNTINVTIAKLRKKLWKNLSLKTYINKWYIYS